MGTMVLLPISTCNYEVMSTLHGTRIGRCPDPGLRIRLLQATDFTFRMSLMALGLFSKDGSVPSHFESGQQFIKRDWYLLVLISYFINNKA